MTEVHSETDSQQSLTQLTHITGVYHVEIGVVAGIKAEFPSQALEGVIARSVELHGLCLVLGVSLATCGGRLSHEVSVAVDLIPAVVPPLLGGVTVGEVLYNRGDDDGVESFCDV